MKRATIIENVDPNTLASLAAEVFRNAYSHASGTVEDARTAGREAVKAFFDTLNRAPEGND